MTAQVVILMGSRSDLDHVTPIAESLGALDVLDTYRDADGPVVFIAVAGRSNALAGMVDANTPWPVITCPPVSSTFGGADIFSSLRMPSGVAPMVVLDPAGAALAAAKVLSLADAALRERIAAHQDEMTDAVVRADQSVLRGER